MTRKLSDGSVVFVFDSYFTEYTKEFAQLAYRYEESIKYKRREVVVKDFDKSGKTWMVSSSHYNGEIPFSHAELAAKLEAVFLSKGFDLRVRYA